MCGVCAGHPKRTSLGDVIVADRLWRYDAGARVGNVNSPARHQYDTSTYNLDAGWKKDAETFSAELRHSPWLALRPQPLVSQARWILNELSEGRDPCAQDSVAGKAVCADWEPALALAEKREWVDLSGGMRLTDAGRRELRSALARTRGDLFRQREWEIRVGPLGSGNDVRRDPEAWEELEARQRRIVGLEMEGASIGFVGYATGTPHTIVVKGVVDHADPEKSDVFRHFAARAAAEVLLGFLREHLAIASGTSLILPSELAPSTQASNGAIQRPRSIANMLRADSGRVPFFEEPRAEELQDLKGWCSEESRLSMRLFTGPGGIGKTRLFIHWANTLAKEGWVAGFLPEDAEECLAGMQERDAPCLVIVDYAECRAHLRTLLRAAVGRGSSGCLRVALLARNSGEWWKALLTDSVLAPFLAAYPPLAIRPLPPRGQLRERAYWKAAESYAAALSREPRGDTPDLSAPLFDRILYVNMLALAHLEGADTTPERLLETILSHEMQFWAEGLENLGLDDFERQLALESMARLVAAVSLRRGVSSRVSALQLAEQIAAQVDERCLYLLNRLYGTGQDGAVFFCSSLQPDLLGEALIVRTLRAEPSPKTFLVGAFRDASEADVQYGLTILGRLALWGHPGSVDWLNSVILDDLASRAVPALEAALSVGREDALCPLGDVLADALREFGTHEIASMLRWRLPRESVGTRRVAFWVYSTLFDALPATATDKKTRAERADLAQGCSVAAMALGDRPAALRLSQEAVCICRELAEEQPGAFRPGLAGSLSVAAVHLALSGRQQEAVALGREAVGIYSELAGQLPEFLPDLCGSLNNLAIHLAGAGWKVEAVTAGQQAVEIYRKLAETLPGVFVPYLAGGLSNLANQLSEVGKKQEAVAAGEEAVEIYRALASTLPDAFLPALAGSLGNLAGHLSEAGRRQEAVAPAQEAVEVHRRLAARLPDAFLPSLAMSQSNLAAHLSRVGRRQEAIAQSREAVGTWSKLAAELPVAFLPGLAGSLTNLATHLADIGAAREALGSVQRAVDFYRRLAEDSPGMFLPDLAASLDTLAVSLSLDGKKGEATGPAQEAVDIYRKLAAELPDAFLSKLAGSLCNLANHFSDIDKKQEAVAAVQEGVEIYRGLSEKLPAAILPGLAGSLNTLANRFSEVNRQQEAVAPAREAVGIYRRLAVMMPDAFSPRLAVSLENLALHLVAVGRQEDAVAPAQEAVDVYRRLAEQVPDVHLPALGLSLIRLADYLRQVGKKEEAIAPVLEAVGVYRGLVRTAPDAALPDFAASLSRLAVNLTGADATRREAVVPAQEAVSIYRQLAEKLPGTFLANLAESLGTLSVCLRRAGRSQEAVAPTQESVDVWRKLGGKLPGTLRPVFAVTLMALSAQLLQAGQKQAALSPAQEAADVYRELAAESPDVHLPLLAMALTRLADCLLVASRKQEAVVPAQEAVEIYRTLSEKRPSAFRLMLATSLGNLGYHLSQAGRHQEADAIAEEAMDIMRSETR
jgi:tetratricopeptide (TPR) repeat protein/nucleoside phosphorylase